MSRTQTLRGSRDEGALPARAGSPGCALLGGGWRAPPSYGQTPSWVHPAPRQGGGIQLSSSRSWHGHLSISLAGLGCWQRAHKGRLPWTPEREVGRTPVPEGLLRALRRRVAPGELGRGRDSGSSWERRERDGLSSTMSCAESLQSCPTLCDL